MSIYTDNGYADRQEYLHAVAEDYDIDYELVKSLAILLGPNEDFDGLIATIQDYYG